MSFSSPISLADYVYLNITKNGIRDTQIINANSNGYSVTNWSWMMELEIGDQINLEVSGPTKLFVSQFSKVIFNGFLIKQK